MKFSLFIPLLFFTFLLIDLVSADCYSGYKGYYTDWVSCQSSLDGIQTDLEYHYRTNCHCDGNNWVYEQSTYDHLGYHLEPCCGLCYDSLQYGMQGIRRMSPACVGHPQCSDCNEATCDNCYGTWGDYNEFRYQCVWNSEVEECYVYSSSDNGGDPFDCSIVYTYNYGQACNPYRCDLKNGYGYFPNGGYLCDAELLTFEYGEPIGICTTNAYGNSNPACSDEKICSYYNDEAAEGQPAYTYVKGCSSECIKQKSDCDKDIWYPGGPPPYNTGDKYELPRFSIEGHCAPDGACNNLPYIINDKFYFFELKEDEDNRKLICNASLSDPELITGEDTLSAKMEIKYKKFSEEEYTKTLFSGIVSCIEEDQRAICVKEIDICSGNVELERDYICNATPYDGHEDGEAMHKKTSLFSATPYVYYINITPDYYELYKDNDNVNYDDIFRQDPMYYCEFKVNDSDCMDDILTVYYNITGLTWPDPKKEEDYRIEGSISCQKETLCKVPIPQDHIRPSDNINCEIYAEDQWEIKSSKKSYQRKVPDFDIRLSLIVPIQSIRSVPLLKDKDTMIRLYANLDSDLIDLARKVNGKDSMGGSGHINKLYEKASRYTVTERHYGGDTINTFSFKPAEVGELEIRGEVNHDLKFKESTFDNNKRKDIFKVKPVKKPYKILYVPVYKEDRLLPSTLTTTNIQKTCKVQTDYLIATYPLPESEVSYYCENRVAAFPIGWSDLDIIRFLPTVLSGGFEGDPIIYGPYIDYAQYDWVVGVLIDEGASLSGGADGVNYRFGEKFILINEDAPEHTTAHEVGHEFGFCEEYETGFLSGWIPFEFISTECWGDWPEEIFPYGSEAEDGWRVKQGVAGHKLSVEPANPKSWYNWYSFMGHTLHPWITRENYLTLMNHMIIGGGDPILLSIYGKIYEDDSIEVLPIFKYEGFYEPDKSGDYSVEIYSGNTLLSTTPFNMPMFGTIDDFSFFGVSVPYDYSLTRIVFKHNQEILKEISRTRNSPKVVINSISEEKNIVTMDWDYFDLDGDTVSYIASLKCDNQDYKTIVESFVKITEFDLSNYPGGNDCHIRIEASDGINTAEAYSRSFSLDNHAPSAYIIKPEEGSVFNSDDKVFIEGFATDLEDIEVKESNLHWYLDNNPREFGNGNYLSLSNLEEGIYTLKLIAIDEEGATGTAERTFIVNDAIESDVYIKDIYFNPSELISEYPIDAYVSVKLDLFSTKQDSLCDVVFYKDGQEFDTQSSFVPGNELITINSYFNVKEQGVSTIRAEINCGDGNTANNIIEKNFFTTGVIYIDSCQILDKHNTIYYLNQNIGGNSFACIRIAAPYVTLDCQGHSITSDSSYIGVYSTQDYTTIKKCDINVGSMGTGIKLRYSSNNHIFDNVLNGQYIGLSSDLVSDSIIENNTINSNKIGILLTEITPQRLMPKASSNNEVSDNFACGNSWYDFKCDQFSEGTYGDGNRFTKVSYCSSNNWPVLGIDYDYCSPSPKPSPSPIPSPTESPTASPSPKPSP